MTQMNLILIAFLLVPTILIISKMSKDIEGTLALDIAYKICLGFLTYPIFFFSMIFGGILTFDNIIIGYIIAFIILLLSEFLLIKLHNTMIKEKLKITKTAHTIISLISFALGVILMFLALNIYWFENI